MKLLNVDAYNQLVTKQPNNWTRTHFSTFHKCDILLNNLCEAFNGAIVEARDKPIITILETIRKYIRKRLVTCRELADKWHHDIGLRVFKILEKSKLESLDSIPKYCGDLKFEVRHMYAEQFLGGFISKDL